jgi:hypothetical protein
MAQAGASHERTLKTMVKFTATMSPFEDTVYQRNSQGRIVQNHVSPADYDCPDDGRYRLMVTGYSDPFELDGQFGVQEKIRVEFEVRDNPKWEGTRFSTMFNIPKSWGAKSKLCQLVGALLGAPVKEGQLVDFDDLIDQECSALVAGQLSAKTGDLYATVDGFQPLMPGRAGAPATERQPKRVARLGDDEPGF